MSKGRPPWHTIRREREAAAQKEFQENQQFFDKSLKRFGIAGSSFFVFMFMFTIASHANGAAFLISLIGLIGMIASVIALIVNIIMMRRHHMQPSST